MTSELEIYSDRFFPEWLQQMQLSLGYTTYQTSRLTLLGVNPQKTSLSLFERTFDRAMGLYISGERLYLSTKYQIWQLDNVLEPGQWHNGFDRLYIPRIGYTTGDLDIHDLVVDASGRVIFVSSLLNCLATVSDRRNCIPLWKPPFITKIINEDCCHLNGLALVDGKPHYATTCSHSDILNSWRSRRRDGGCVLDVLNNEIIATGLSMPHSPRFYRGKLWLLNSGTGELGYVDLRTGQFEPVAFCPGFLRGLAFWQNWAIVGLSKPRGSDQNFSGLPLEETLSAKNAEAQCGLMVVDLNTGRIAHWYRIEGMVTELYDVQVLPGVKRPMMLGFQTEEITQLITLEPSQDLFSLYLSSQTTPSPSTDFPRQVVISETSTRPQERVAQDYFEKSRHCKQQGDLTEAERFLREALRLKPDYWGAYNNLGTLLQQQGRLEEACNCYEAALQYHPDFAEAIANRASLWLLQGELELAKPGLVRALQLKPKYWPAHFNLARLYQQQGRLQAAIEHFQRAIELNPQHFEAVFELAQIYEYQDRLELALQYYQQAQQLKQDKSIDYSLFLEYARLKLCDWQNYQSRIQTCLQTVETTIAQGNISPVKPLTLSALPTPPALHQAVAMRQAQVIRQEVLQQETTPYFHSRSRSQRLRIGYLSPDFRNHAVGRLVWQLFEHHDRSRFTVSAYMTVDMEDEITTQIQKGCDRFINVSALTSQQAAQQIYQDKIDLLIDLAGYTMGNGAAILALQPAPIQIEWLGYPDTLGAEFVQYLLADSWLVPPEMTRFYTEQIVYLPHAFVGSALTISDRRFNRAELGLPEDGFVFCCFNSHYKITPEVFDCWMNILHQVPGSVLWLLEGCAPLIQNLRHEAQQRGIEPERLVFAERLDYLEYLARYECADLFLDTFTYNAGSTAIAALWGGVPVLTQPGQTNASRMGASICTAAHLESMICESVEAYLEQAVYLATYPAELATIRRQLSGHRDLLPLFNLTAFVRTLESTLETLWMGHNNEI